MSKSNFSRDINNDGIQKRQDYAEAVNRLNDSLTGVNSALTKFTDGLDVGLKAIALHLSY